MNAETNIYVAYLIFSNLCIGFAIWFFTRMYYLEVIKGVEAKGIADGVDFGVKLEQAGWSKKAITKKKKSRKKL